MKLIAAQDINGAIGKDNTLPWHIPEDLKQFKAITLNNTILMGRKTYESIGRRPLPKRRNLILTSQKDLKANGCEIVNSIEEALEIDPNLFVIGGSDLYRRTIDQCSELYLTIIKTEIKDPDTYFPNISRYDWNIKSQQFFYKNEKNRLRYY